MREHAERLTGLGTTIFAEMSALAVATDSVNLGQGFPDRDGPDSLLEDAIAAIRAGANQYPPGRGVPALRQAIADHQKRFYDLSYDPDTEVLVTTGATEAIAAALLAFVEPGDEVIALEPYYDSYAAGIAFAGGRRVPVTLRAPEYRLDLDELRAAVTPRTKVLLINSPHNPTGTVLTDEELRGVARRRRRARSGRHHRRGLRTPRVRRTRAPAARVVRRNGGTDRVDQQRRQDVRRHRLEDRVGHRHRPRW